MVERQTSKPEIAAQKKVIKLAPAIGDWTTYKPPKILVKKVKSGLYGFDRLSKEELNLVLLTHYRFIQKFLKHLKIDLKMAVELFQVQVQQTTYLNFLRSLTGPVVQSKIIIPQSHDAVSVFFSLPLANSAINYALGSQDLEPISRGLTEAENMTFSTILNECLPDYQAAFENVFENPSFVITGSPDVAIDSSINTSSTFVSFSAEVIFADNSSGQISFGYLGNSIKTLLAKYHRTEEQKSLDFSQLPLSLLAEIKIPLQVNLGSSSLSTSEIDQLEGGDVVSLDTSISSPTSLKLANALKLFCQPGTKDKKAAVRITAFKEAGELSVPPPPLAKEEKEEEKPKPEKEKKEKKEEPPQKEIEKEEKEFEAEEDFLEEFPEEEFLEDEFPEDEEL